MSQTKYYECFVCKKREKYGEYDEYMELERLWIGYDPQFCSLECYTKWVLDNPEEAKKKIYSALENMNG